MKSAGTMLLCVAVFFMASVASAQISTLPTIREHLDEDQLTEAASLLGEALSNCEGEEQFDLLQQTWGLFSERGCSDIWLFGLHGAVEATAQNRLLRYYRGYRMTDLKRLRHALTDIKQLRREKPDDPFYIEALARVAWQRFDYAGLSALDGGAIELSEHTQELVAGARAKLLDLSAAKSRQRRVLMGLGALFLVVLFLVYKRFLPSRS